MTDTVEWLVTLDGLLTDHSRSKEFPNLFDMGVSTSKMLMSPMITKLLLFSYF